MQFLALIYGDEARWEALDDREREEIHARYRAFADEAGAAGKLVDGAELAPTSAATTVRVREGQTLVTDGPFAETKEALGGFFLLECDGWDEALELAARIPAAADGAVEVRPAYVDEAEPSNAAGEEVEA